MPTTRRHLEVLGPEYVELFAKQRAEYAAEGKQRVRKHEANMIDVTDMNDTGTQAIVQYRYVDQSYWADKGGKARRRPTNDETEWQLTIDKKADRVGGLPDDRRRRGVQVTAKGVRPQLTEVM